MRIRLKRERLVDEVARSHLTQNHWAIKLGLSRGHFSEILNGKHPYLSPRTRQKILDGLDIPFDELFEIEAGDAWTGGSVSDFQAALADRYVIDREVGQGGMGTVYLARDVKHGRVVAIKIISPEVVSGVGADQFLREIRYTSRLEHPNILTLHDSGEAAGYPYYIMPYIRAGSLRDALASRGRMTIDDALSIVCDVAAALDFAHQSRIVHCDIKPANVLLAPRHAYVADFGISRAIHAEDRRWRRVGEIDSSAGTPAYVSPEQAAGDPNLDGRADVYSFACVVFEMLTGQSPFAGKTTMEVVSRRFTDEIPNARAIVSDVPAAVAAVIERAMAVEPIRRYQTVGDFANAFEIAVRGRHPVAEMLARGRAKVDRIRWRSPSTGTPRRSPRRWRMDQLMGDVRFALRSMRQRPGFATVAILILGLGVGANTAIFALINAIFLRAPMGADPERLVEIYRNDGDYSAVSHRDVRDIRNGMTDLFTAVTSYKIFTGQVGGATTPSQVVQGELVNANYFAVFGIDPAAGRFFVPSEDVTPETHPVVVLGHRFWQGRFDGSTSVVGRPIRLNGRSYTVVGVAPQTFPGRVPGLAPDIWVPMMMENHLYPGGLDNNHLYMTARLRDGVSAGAVDPALQALVQRIDDERGRPDRGYEYAVIRYVDVTLHPQLDGPIRAMAVLLLTVVAAVLLIACTNLASFMLARALDRRREMAVRLALGAGRWTLIRQLLAESVLLGLAGGIVGLVIGGALVRLLMGIEPPFPTPIYLDAQLDLRVLAFTLLAGIVAGTAFGLLPALQASRQELAQTLRAEAAAATGGKGRVSLRTALVAVQVALSLVLLAGAGLFIQSLRRMLAVDVGFATRPAAIVAIDARGSGYDAGESPALYDRVADRLRSIPGLEELTVTDRLPLHLGRHSRAMRVPGHEVTPDRPYRFIEMASVDPNYFEFMDIGLIQGRGFGSMDRDDTQRVGIVSRATEERYWPSGAVGRTIYYSGDPETPVTVVGVAEDVKVGSLTESPRSFLYVPRSQEGSSRRYFVARGAITARALVEAMRRAALDVDPGLYVSTAHTLDDHMSLMYYLPRMAVIMLVVSAALAVVLASVGLYGVVSYTVSRRTREMGIRISLGARAGDVIALVLRGGLAMVLTGALFGLLGAWSLGRLLERFLVGVSGRDPLTLVGVSIMIVGVAALAAFVPARRASRVDPVRALRAD